MKGSLAIAGFLVVLIAPSLASAAVIREQSVFNEVENVSGDVPLIFSGASQRTPSLISLFSATGTVRTAKIRYDMSSWTNPLGAYVYLYECPLQASDALKECHRVVARDPLLGWDGQMIHPPATNSGELSVDFTSAVTTDFTPTEYFDGVPLIPTRGYRLEAIFEPNAFNVNVHGKTGEVGGFTPYFKLEGDVATSTPATTTPPVCTVDCNSNVMFLPGIEGSRLYDTDGGESKLWDANDSSIRQLEMSPDGTSLRGDIYTRDILDSVGIFKFYQPLMDKMNALKNAGKINDWKDVPYDWRLSLDQLISGGSQVGEKISYLTATSSPYISQTLLELASSSRTHKVTIVAHSNGGLLVKVLLARHPELSARIDKIIFVGVPQLGTPQAIEAVVSGKDEAIPFLVHASTIRALAQNMPMSYNLLPSRAYFTNIDDPVILFDPETMQDWISRYGTEYIHSTDRLNAFLLDPAHTTVPTFDDKNFDDVVRVNPLLLNNAGQQHDEIDTWNPGQIELIEIAGWGKETLSGITYSRESQNVCVATTPNGNCAAYQSRPAKLSFSPNFVVDGDDTVVGPSALATNQSQGSNYWLNLEGGSISHPSLFRSSALLSFIENSITGSSDPVQGVTSSEPSSSEDRLHFVLHSPLTLGFVDGQGRYTGSVGSTTSKAEVPNVEYIRFGDVQWLSLPKNLSGKMILKGVSSGSFSLEVKEVHDGSIIAQTKFSGVPSATNTIATIAVSPTISVAKVGVLEIDFNGDGTTDRTLFSKESGVVLPDLIPPEAVITVSTSTKDLLVTGKDSSSSTTVEMTATSTVITDGSGNRTIVFTKKTFSGNILSYARIAGINYATSTTALPTSMLYVWDKTNTLISQTVVADNNFVIEALYDKGKNKTTIFVKKRGVPLQSVSVLGVKIIKLTTDRGGVTYTW